MEWTPELDALLVDLHTKRLGNSFIASWMRIKPAFVRDRLVELGLARPLPAKAAAAPTRKELRAAALSHGSEAEAGDDDPADDEDDSDCHAASKHRRRPRGYLMSIGEIDALYRSIGRTY